MKKATSMKMYAYEELSLFSVTERSFTIKGKDNKETIVFTSKEISQVKGNHKGNVREYRFIGHCVFFYESFSNKNKNYFEMVFQEANAISEYNRFIRIGDFYAFVEITPNTMKPVTKSDVFWAESGIVLGTAGVVGVIFTGAISIGAVLTVFYGVNTIFSSTVDMTFCFSGNGEKLGSFNFIRDSVFGNIGQFFEYKGILNKSKSKNYSNIAYLTSELILAGTGIRSIFKELQTGWKIGKGYVSMKSIKTSLYNSPGMGGGGKEIYFERLGYHVYQIFDSLKSGKGYVVQIYKEAKEIETKSKVKFTNSSAIEMLR